MRVVGIETNLYDKGPMFRSVATAPPEQSVKVVHELADVVERSMSGYKHSC